MMKRKFALAVLIAVSALMVLSAAHAAEENQSANKTLISMEANHPMKISELVNMVKNHPKFKNYDYGALKWLDELDSDDVVYSADAGYVVMNSTEAAKIPDTVTTGVSYNCNITCNVLENQSLGPHLDDVLVIEDVEVVSGDLNSFDFGSD
jgi:hypothetical protein